MCLSHMGADAALVPVVLEALSDLLTVTNPQEVADWETSGGDRKDALTHPASRSCVQTCCGICLPLRIFSQPHDPLLQTLGPT